MGNGGSIQTTGGSLPPATPPPPGVTRLRHCAQQCNKCISKEDGELLATKFLMAGSAFVEFIRHLGGFAGQSADEVRKHLSTIMRAGSQRTLREVLTDERARNALAYEQQDSAARGAIWVVRTMRFWEKVCSERLEIAAGRVADPPSFHQTVMSAYESVLKSHLDGGGRAAFELAAMAAPAWDEIRAKLVLEDGTDADFAADAAEFLPLVGEVADQLEALLHECYPQYVTHHAALQSEAAGGRPAA